MLPVHQTVHLSVVELAHVKLAPRSIGLSTRPGPTEEWEPLTASPQCMDMNVGSP